VDKARCFAGLLAAEGPLDTDCGALLIVDDDAAFREFVSSLLDRMGHPIVEATDGDEALDAALAERPSLVVLDIDLPGASGYEICRALRDVYGEDLPIIFVSGRRTEQLDLVAGLLIGADDYLVKPFDGAELLARVRRHLSRAPRSPNGDAGARLTPREQEILDLLAAGLDQREIAERLVISPKTVGTHIQRILGKLGVRSRAQAVAYAHRHGLVDAAPASF
jgi:DNA-binding NarL/FixJ family response regulator